MLFNALRGVYKTRTVYYIVESREVSEDRYELISAAESP